MVTLLLLMSFGAAFIQRVSGFGFGIFIMTALPFLLPTYGEATALSGLLAAVTSIIIVAREWRHLAWKRLILILLTFLVISYFAVGWVSCGSEILLKRLLGAVLIVAAVWFAFLKDRVKLPTTWPAQLAMGSLSGVMGGLFGMQGPPAVLYFVATNHTKESYIAMAQTYFLVGNLFMTYYRFRAGFVTPTVCHAWLCAVPAVLVGTWVGSLVFKRISLPVLRTVIYFYMALTGLYALLW